MAATAASVLLAIGLMAAITHVHVYADASEDRRNSFSTQDETALRSLGERLKITVHLAATDPRRHDLERSVLGKLLRTMPNVSVDYAASSSNQEATTRQEDPYGLINYEYAGRHAESRSTSEEEILPLIFRLAATRAPPRDSVVDYPGYPLVASTRAAEVGFYFVGPMIVLACWALAHGVLRPLRFSTPNAG